MHLHLANVLRKSNASAKNTAPMQAKQRHVYERGRDSQATIDDPVQRADPQAVIYRPPPLIQSNDKSID